MAWYTRRRFGDTPYYANSAAECPAGWSFVAAGRSSRCVPPPGTNGVVNWDAIMAPVLTPPSASILPVLNSPPPLSQVIAAPRCPAGQVWDPNWINPSYSCPPDFMCAPLRPGGCVPDTSTPTPEPTVPAPESRGTSPLIVAALIVGAAILLKG